MDLLPHLLRPVRALAADRTRRALENLALRHVRPRIVPFNVTQHPAAEWTAQQLTEAVPGDGTAPRYLHRERDAIYGNIVRQRIASIGMKEVINAKQSPGQDPHAERVIGSIRRECTNPLVPLNEAHLRDLFGGLHHEYRRAG